MKTLFAQPLITEKSMAQSATGVYQFVTPKWATKRQIAEFVENHFSVSVINVTTSTLRGNKVTFKQRRGEQATYKKASVRLKQGDSITEFALPVETQDAAPSAPMMSTPEGEPVTESKITVRSKSKKTAAKTEEK